jgi:hypothetical protein
MRVPTVDGYSVEISDRRVTTEMESGNFMRVEFRSEDVIASCSAFFDSLQSAWFEAFEHDMLVQGSKWMRMPLWSSGQLSEHTVRFRERPKLVSKFGDHSTYSFRLEVEKRENMMDPELVWLLLLHDPYILLKSDERLQKCVNVSYPAALPFPG